MRHTGDSERVHDSDWEARDDGGTWVGDPSFEAGFAESGRMGTQADTGFAKADLERDLPTLSAGSWNSARGTVSAMGGGAWPQPSTSSSTGGQSVETMPTTPSSNYQYDQWDSLALPPQTPLHSSTTQSQQSLNQNHNVRTHFHSESNEYTMLRRASDSRLYVSAGNGNQEHRYHPHPSLNPISEYNQQANSSQSSPLRHPSSPSSFIATTALSSHLQVHSGAQASNNFNHTNRGVTNSFNAPLSASPLVVLPALPSQQAASNSSQHLRSRTVSANFPHSFSSSSSLGGNLLASVDQKHLSSIESLWAPPSLDTLFLASTSSSLTGKQQVQPRRQVSSSSSFENRDIIDDLAFASSSPDSIGNYGSRVSLLGPHPASSVFGPPQSIALASQTGTRYRSTSASSSFSAPASGAAISSDNLLPAGKMGLSVAAPEYKPLTGPASGPGLRVQAPVYTPLSGLSMPGSVAVVGPSQPVVGGGGSSTSEQVGGMVGAALEGPKAAAFIVAGPANVLVGDSGSTMPAGAAGMNGAETKPEDVERMIQERGLNPNPAQFDLRPVNVSDMSSVRWLISLYHCIRLAPLLRNQVL
ncbi:hypothetical protein BC830DRAFT_490954 [Chytriomyces sp. MP71]|nr:hypothetical protein BC830DRAFT_490954 [Chytriomyces sp. MP71]